MLKENKFVVPEAYIIAFNMGDIILTSNIGSVGEPDVPDDPEEGED